jgi:tRNA(Ile)-lysidine synthase
LDSEKLNGELRIRPWKNGDFIQPVGMTGRQLVSDIIKDAKIDSHSKQSVFVIHDDQNLHWVLGLKVGRLAIASEKSQRIIKVHVSD